MPEESGNPPNQHDETLRRLERRIESLEYAADRENKWWRGGLIAALVLVALSILIAGHHRHHRPPTMVMRDGQGMQGMGRAAHDAVWPAASASLLGLWPRSGSRIWVVGRVGSIASGTVRAPTVRRSRRKVDSV